VLKLTDAKGTQLAFNDDYDDPGAGLETHHADSRILTTLPANGTYYLYLGDAQQKGGPEYAYRLRIGAPRPDFDLRVTPSSINVSGGLERPLEQSTWAVDGLAKARALMGSPILAGYHSLQGSLRNWLLDSSGFRCSNYMESSRLCFLQPVNRGDIALAINLVYDLARVERIRIAGFSKIACDDGSACRHRQRY